ncbi:MAG: hypothetical protein HYU63_01430 [Armatimonadetes bacterium]|nr:hypothetical protein [Armatimonadota bacterium]
MRIKLYFSIILIFTIFSIKLAFSQDSKRIAVINIKNSAGISYFWQGDFDPAQAMTDLIINQLIKSQRFLVFDRQNLAAVMQEHNLSVSGEITPETAVEVGKLIGVEYILTGSVTEFSQVGEEGGGAIAIPLPWGGGVKLKSKKVRCAVSLHLTNVSSGLYGAGITAKDETTVQDFGFAGFVGGVGLGYNNEEFLNSALGKSMNKVAQDAVNQLETVQFKEVPQSVKLEGYVIDVDGEQISLNIGAKHGIVKGMRFIIFRPKEITDPLTKEKKILNKPVGEIEIISVDEETCTGKAAPGTQGVMPKDKAKRK